ncbi:hypothetical protein C8A00DRAFT_41981 [Chaetomidium leptoderma]|uniref:2EXR domain-containing protein n=1 Tax=Chaetomidium leptoderma TaxID=669021 RepID=A0AAN6VPJ5_9PEZI|nr:hypothetical protein C8A00DRAFT_41981 [Chaetomidium leptoderma]
MTSPSPLSSSFTLFPNLPPELRLQIYRHSCHPRVTTLSYLPAPADTFHCPTHPPTLLHVSRESRAEGLRLYARCFFLPHSETAAAAAAAAPTTTTTTEAEAETEAEEGRLRRYFYYHPHADTLYFPRPTPAADPLGQGYAQWAVELAVRLPALVGLVRRLAVDYVPGDVRRPWEVYRKVALIQGCSRLEEAFLVVASVTSGSTTTSSSSIGTGSGSAAAAAAVEGGRNHGEEMMQGGGEVEFVDPRADDEEIVGIMERVRESFRYKLGDGFRLGLPRKEGRNEMNGVEEGELELIPKAKVLSPWAGRHIACAS